MTGEQLRMWRTKKMMWTQPYAAQRLGICVASIQSYERGTRSDKTKPIEIPLLVALACSALAHELQPWGVGKK